MKKTMFITSVIMVVVLAIALTTSSLAWFTAGGARTVSTADIVVNAASAQAVGAGLEIRKSTTGNWNTSTPISLTEVTGGFVPACPLVEASNVTSFDNTTSRPTAISQDVLRDALLNNMWNNKTYDANGVETFKGVPVQAISGSNLVWHDDFYIRNSGSSATNVTISIGTAFGDGKLTTGTANMWVALFDVVETAPAQDETPATYRYDLLAISQKGDQNINMTLATSIEQLGGEYQETTLVAKDGATADAISGERGVATSIFGSLVTLNLAGGNINAQEVAGPAHHLEFFVWMDGQSLHNGNQNSGFTVNFEFSIPA